MVTTEIQEVRSALEVESIRSLKPRPPLAQVDPLARTTSTTTSTVLARISESFMQLRAEKYMYLISFLYQRGYALVRNTICDRDVPDVRRLTVLNAISLCQRRAARRGPNAGSPNSCNGFVNRSQAPVTKTNWHCNAGESDWRLDFKLQRWCWEGLKGFGALPLDHLEVLLIHCMKVITAD